MSHIPDGLTQAEYDQAQQDANDALSAMGGTAFPRPQPDRVEILTDALRCTFARCMGADTARVFREELTRAEVELSPGFGADATEDTRPPDDDKADTRSVVAAEIRLLGGVLLNPDMLATTAKFIQHYHFADPAHAAVFRAMSAAYNFGEPITIDTVSARMEPDHFSSLGGSAYLNQLCGAGANMAAFSIAMDVTRTVRDAWKRRELVRLGAYMQEQGNAMVERALDEALSANRNANMAAGLAWHYVRSAKAIQEGNAPPAPINISDYSDYDQELPF